MMQFRETRNYGFNEIIKQYARFPWYMPLPAHFEHGWTPAKVALKSDLKLKKPLMLVFSKRRAEAWSKTSQIPVEIMGSPFIHFKNMHRIVKQIDAKGTVVFPSHSTYGLRSQFSIEKYCQQLKNLPKEFQPVTICLFWLDYIEKKADIYRKSGFKVITAGYKFSTGLSFVRNYYRILSSYKYATSNEVGSYAFYAVDLGIPFFLTGEIPLINNIGNEINTGKSVRIDDFRHGIIASEIFDTGPVAEISSKQKKFVELEMGTKYCLSRVQMHDLFKRYNQSYQSVTATAFYLLESIFLKAILNGPWGKAVISLRKWLTQRNTSKLKA